MVQHMVKSGEVAPLLLDEVTAQADRVRMIGIMEILHRVSIDRRLSCSLMKTEFPIGRVRLSGPNDRVIKLEPAVGASA